VTKVVMKRLATDNAYLHKDFHGALSDGLIYLEQRYGGKAVREYLRQFATAFYAPLTQSIRERGLAALREHLERTYALEGGDIRITGSADELLLEVASCPAVTHMREAGYAVAPLFGETSKTVYETICAGTPFACQWLHYDEATGRAAVRFFRRQP
jgi:hypothetical protein